MRRAIFPFAFSVLGGDTASALAAGCAVVVKAHDGHSRTSARVLALARDVLSSHGVSPQLISVVFGFNAGVELVRHQAVDAAGFTGSAAGGRALFDLAARRPRPIPFFGELGSTNPVVISPGAAAQRPVELAAGYVGSLTLGNGQFCTKPGLLFVPEDDALSDAIATAVNGSLGAAMLTGAMGERYAAAAAGRDRDAQLAPLAKGMPADGPWAATPQVWAVGLEAFASDPALADELFGPAGLIVRYPAESALLRVLPTLPGSLAAAVHATSEEEHFVHRAAGALRPRVGRLIYNGWPTGVAVRWAMHHGGPWPASTAPAHTSVGLRALARWLTPTAFQDWPVALLPDELRSG